jgi:hypothetical protein
MDCSQGREGRLMSRHRRATASSTWRPTQRVNARLLLISLLLLPQSDNAWVREPRCLEDWAPKAVIHAHGAPLLCDWRSDARAPLSSIGLLNLFADEWPRPSFAMLRKRTV